MSEIFKLKQLPELCSELIGQKPFGKIVGLKGELGSGKTTFTACLLAKLGVNEPVTSPSYNLCHEYFLEDGRQVEHWDLYRLNSAPEELLSPPDQNTLVLVEWVDRCAEIDPDLMLEFSYTDPPQANLREIALIKAR